MPNTTTTGTQLFAVYEIVEGPDGELDLRRVTEPTANRIGAYEQRARMEAKGWPSNLCVHGAGVAS